MKYAVTFFLAFAAVKAATINKITNLKYSNNNCGPNDPIYVTSANLQPDPVVIPGTVYVSFDITLDVGIVSPTPASITFSYRPDDSTDYTDLPCVGGVLGTCELEDICDFVNFLFPPGASCPESFIEQDVPCHCPFEGGSYSLTNAPIVFNRTLEELGLQPGDYYLKFLIGTADNELQCEEYTYTVISG